MAMASQLEAMEPDFWKVTMKPTPEVNFK